MAIISYIAIHMMLTASYFAGNKVKAKKKSKKQTCKSDKEKVNDVPSWARNYKKKNGESGSEFAKRICGDHFGKGKYKVGPSPGYNKIKKWGNRGW